VDAAAILCQVLRLLIRFPLMWFDVVLFRNDEEREWMNVYTDILSGFLDQTVIQLHQ
jgi:hypothetical protein